MKKLVLFALLLFLLSSCDLLLECPDSRFIGKWEYFYDYSQDDLRYTSMTLTFDNSNYFEEFTSRNKYYTFLDSDTYLFYYFWRVDGNKFYRHLSSTKLVKNTMTDEECFTFRFENNKLILTNEYGDMEYIKQ